MEQSKNKRIIVGIIILVVVAAALIAVFATKGKSSLTYGDYKADKCIHIWLASDNPDVVRSKEESSTLNLAKDSLTITYSASEEKTYNNITYRKNDDADKAVAALTEKDYAISKDSSPVLYDVCEKDTVRYKLLAFDDTVIVFTPGTKAAWGEDDDLLQNAYTITEYTLQ